MRADQLPDERRTCEHGMRLPSPYRVAVIADRLAHQDFGGAIWICVDWCGICTGLCDEQHDGDSR